MQEPSDVTVELDGLGRQLSELPTGGGPAQEALTQQSGPADGAEGPVFVDESGRRGKKFRRLGWIVAIACAFFAVTLGVSLMGGSSSAPWLRIPAFADKEKSDSVEVKPSPTTSESGGAEPGGSGSPTPQVTNSGVVPDAPRTNGVVSGKQDSPDPGTSATASPDTPPAGSTGGGPTKNTGGTGGTGKPDTPVVTPTGHTPDDDPTGSPGDPPTDPDAPVDPPTDPDAPPVDPPQDPVDPPPADTGGQQLAAEGAQ